MLMTATLIFIGGLSIGMYLVVMFHPKFKSACTQECNQGRSCTCANTFPNNQSS